MNKKRFIAGAVCPHCGLVDKIVLFREGEFDYRECVRCGFKDQMRFKSTPHELDTRVNRTAEQIKAETQVIQFVGKESKQQD